ncbi:hypothetical protein BDR22DRAFT_144626 [Usnea florida]
MQEHPLYSQTPVHCTSSQRSSSMPHSVTHYFSLLSISRFPTLCSIPRPAGDIQHSEGMEVTGQRQMLPCTRKVYYHWPGTQPSPSSFHSAISLKIAPFAPFLWTWIMWIHSYFPHSPTTHIANPLPSPIPHTIPLTRLTHPPEHSPIANPVHHTSPSTPLFLLTKRKRKRKKM